MKSFFQIRKDYHQPHTNSMLHTFLGSLMAPSVGQNLLGIFHAQQIWHHQHLFLFLEDSGLCIRNQWEKYCPEMNTNQMHCKIYLALKKLNHSTSEKKNKKEKQTSMKQDMVYPVIKFHNQMISCLIWAKL